MRIRAWVGAGMIVSAIGQLPAPPNAISGKVTDETGKPVREVMVTLIQRDVRYGITRFHPVNVQLHAMTDLAGQYKFEPVALGEVYVVALPRNAQVTGDGRANRSGYAVTYHPRAKRAEDAKPVMVNVREPQVADITLLPAPLAVVSGTVIGSNGSPAASARVVVARGNGLFGLPGTAFTSRPDGTFALAGMNPGTYYLHFREGVWPPRNVETPLISGATVAVDGSDVRDVRVGPIRMVKASGRVIVDPSARGALRPSAITIVGTPINFDGNPGPSRPGTLQDDLTFEFRNWPGISRVRVMGIEDGGWSVAAIRYRGVDVTTAGIDFKDGEEITGIEIELRRQ